MSKHTPGPWKWEQDTDSMDCMLSDGFNYPWEKVEKYMEIGLRGPNREDIIPWRIDHYEWEIDGDWMSKADRQLIAAAPDMLEALKDIADGYMTDTSEIVSKAKQAIAKAEGME